MKKSCMLILAFLFSVAFLHGPAADAAVVRVELTGVVTTIGSKSISEFNAIGVDLGDPFAAFFIYDTGAADENPGDTARSEYVNAVLSYSVSVGVWSVGDNNVQGSSLIWITDRNDGNDSWEMRVIPDIRPSDAPSVLGTLASLEFNLFNVASSREPLSSDSILLPTGLSNWDGAQLNLQGPGGGATRLFLRPDTLTVTVIPEPATLALFGIGLAGLGLAARRRRG